MHNYAKAVYNTTSIQQPTIPAYTLLSSGESLARGTIQTLLGVRFSQRSFAFVKWMRRTARDPLINEPRCDDEGGDGAKRSRPSWPKRKVAMMLGYSGAGYQGMQL